MPSPIQLTGFRVGPEGEDQELDALLNPDQGPEEGELDLETLGEHGVDESGETSPSETSPSETSPSETSPSETSPSETSQKTQPSNPQSNPSAKTGAGTKPAEGQDKFEKSEKPEAPDRKAQREAKAAAKAKAQAEKEAAKTQEQAGETKADKKGKEDVSGQVLDRAARRQVARAQRQEERAASKEARDKEKAARKADYTLVANGSWKSSVLVANPELRSLLVAVDDFLTNRRDSEGYLLTADQLGAKLQAFSELEGSEEHLAKLYRDLQRGKRRFTAGKGPFGFYGPSLHKKTQEVLGNKNNQGIFESALGSKLFEKIKDQKEPFQGAWGIRGGVLHTSIFELAVESYAKGDAVASSQLAKGQIEGVYRFGEGGQEYGVSFGVAYEARMVQHFSVSRDGGEDDGRLSGSGEGEGSVQGARRRGKTHQFEAIARLGNRQSGNGIMAGAGVMWASGTSLPYNGAAPYLVMGARDYVRWDGLGRKGRVSVGVINTITSNKINVPLGSGQALGVDAASTGTTAGWIDQTPLDFGVVVEFWPEGSALSSNPPREGMGELEGFIAVAANAFSHGRAYLLANQAALGMDSAVGSTARAFNDDNLLLTKLSFLAATGNAFSLGANIGGRGYNIARVLDGGKIEHIGALAATEVMPFVLGGIKLSSGDRVDRVSGQLQLAGEGMALGIAGLHYFLLRQPQGSTLAKVSAGLVGGLAGLGGLTLALSP
ncbi:MAG: hypothetical protein KDK66_06625, partial [Deltaproteobacteria bacterium]|nr:hypothetical protein [Deltaproteobacteria bacterium]